MLLQQLILTITFLIIVFNSFSSALSNAVVPDTLKDYNIVIENEENLYTIKDRKSYEHELSFKATILNKEGEKYIEMLTTTVYDKFSKVENVECVLNEVNGKQIKKYKEKDFTDYALGGNYALVADNRCKFININHAIFPYVITFYARVKSYNTMFYPIWHIERYPQNTLVRSSIFTINVASGLDIRHKSENAGTPEISKNEKNVTYRWKLVKVAVKKPKPYQLPELYEPLIITTATNFYIDEYEGRLSDWNEFGKFNQQLLKGRQELPDDFKAKVTELIADKKDKKEIVRTLYEFMQKNTRYVSIQLGIGGWQPFDAAFVAKNGYGDCKALSNFMMSMLKLANIKSYYTLVRAGSDAKAIDATFPSPHFNHAFLCVPLDKDTIWLECTSQISVFNSRSNFTDDRYCLLITEEGGKLVRTPAFTHFENYKLSTSTVTVKNGSINIACKNEYKGQAYDEKNFFRHHFTLDEQKEALAKNIRVKNFSIEHFNYVENRNSGSLTENIFLYSINKSINLSDARFVIPISFPANGVDIPVKDTERKEEIFIRRNMLLKDSMIVEIPKGFKLENTIVPIETVKKWGSYAIKYSVGEDKVIIVREFKLFKGLYDAALYEEFYNYLKDCNHTDKTTLSFVKT